MKILPNGRKILYVRIITCWKMELCDGNYYLHKENGIMDKVMYPESHINDRIKYGYWKIITRDEYMESERKV